MVPSVDMDRGWHTDDEGRPRRRGICLTLHTKFASVSSLDEPSRAVNKADDGALRCALVGRRSATHERWLARGQRVLTTPTATAYRIGDRPAAGLSYGPSFRARECHSIGTPT